MPEFSPAAITFAHRLHRWGGLFLAAFILFYSLTGIMLNHRQAFSFFYQSHTFSQHIKPADNQPVNLFLNHYKKQIKRPDIPKVIRLRDNGKKIEFLYGFHGQTTVIIDTVKGSMQTVIKEPVEPFSWLSSLHKTFKTSRLWTIITDLLSALLCVVTLAVLLVMRYRPLDLIMLIGGVFLCAIGGFLA